MHWLGKPNKLTLLRALLVIPFALLFNAKVAWMLWACLLLLILMGLTDLLDGWLARRNQTEHREGELIDSVADGIVRFTVFLSYFGEALIPLWMLLLVIWRDLFSWGLRFMDLARGRDEVHKRISGKVNGAVQSLSIGIILLALIYSASNGQAPPKSLIWWSMLAAVITATWSIADLAYVHRGTLYRFWKQR